MIGPTFIEMPIRALDGKTLWIKADDIVTFGETPEGYAAISTTDGTAVELDVSFYEFQRILRVVGCTLLTIDDIDNIERSQGEDISE